MIVEGSGVHLHSLTSITNLNPNQLSSQGLPEVSCDVTDEAMHRYLCDAMACDRVHGFPHGTERWFVNSREIELGFSRGQRVYGKLAMHEGKQSGQGCRFPFQ